MLDQVFNFVEGINNKIDINRGVDHVLFVPFSHPVGSLMGPVLIMGLISPNSSVGKTRVVISVLGSLDGVEIHPDFESYLLSGVEKPFDFLSGSISASNVWSILFQSPVTDWKTDQLDSLISEILKMLLV